uniref:TonB-dependent receptor n=2 Tax=Sphingomonas sp. JE1 TaxID=1628059 RepID=A0A0D5A075_9SPHN|nr:TonB-dependent receptor [Sphingomonas sp. JE1]
MPNLMIKAAARAGASSIAVIFAISSVQAQDAASSPAAAPQDVAQESGLQDIVVTAQRRSQSLRDVPISVQAVDGDAIAQQVILNTSDLASISPTVNFTGGGAFNTAFALRGVSSVAFAAGIQPSTAMVIDGVPVVRQSEFNARLADIDRVEVLNGPQGTLFGKNSTAGVINVVTKAPTDKFEGMLEGIITTDDELSVNAMVNVPLSDKVRFRANGFYAHLDPLIKNAVGPDAYFSKSYGISAKLAFDLSEDATFTLVGVYSYANTGFGQLLRAGPTAFNGLTEALTNLPSRRGVKALAINEDVKDLAKRGNITGTLEWKLNDDFSLISITNYTKYRGDSTQDRDITPAGADLGKGETLPGNTYPFQSVHSNDPAVPDKFNYFSQEVRFNYVSGPINAIFGGYFSSFHERYGEFLPAVLDGAFVGATPGVLFFVKPEASSRLKNRTASVFGDVTVDLTDTLKAFGGLRYTNERVSVDYHRDTFFGPYSAYNPVTGVFNLPPVATYDVSSQKTINNLSGRVGLQFQPNRDLNIYGSYARGYKGPAAALSNTLLVGRDPILEPEIADAFEVGTKVRMFDNAVSLNLAAFYETIDDIQASTPERGNGVNILLQNAGKLKIRGFEGDTQWLVAPSLRLSGALAYVKATYSGFAYPCNSVQVAAATCPDFTGPGLQDITGQQSIGAPKWKYSVSADYETNLPGTDLGFNAQMSWTWNSSIQYSLGDEPLTREPSRGMLNASVGLKGPDGRWEVQVFGKNLTNKFYYNSLFSTPIIGSTFGFLPRDYHRYIGLKATTRF